MLINDSQYAIPKRDMKRYWIIWATFLVALLLEVMPWPQQFILLRPNWVMLVLSYWVLALPHRISIGTGFLLGLLMDIITGSPLGTYALVFSIITYLLSFKFQLIRNTNLWKQALIIFVLSCVMNILLFLLAFLFRNLFYFDPLLILQCTVNAILWPWLFLLLRALRQRFKVV